MLQFDRDFAAAQADAAKLASRRPRLEARAKMMSALRTWFAQNDFLELESPVRIPAPALEDYIDAVEAGAGRWLRTSPELHLKRVLAAGFERTVLPVWGRRRPPPRGVHDAGVVSSRWLLA